MFWITYDPSGICIPPLSLACTLLLTNPLASSSGAEIKKWPLAHWSGLIRMITLQWKRPSAEWWSDCSLVDCLVCGGPQWRIRWKTGTRAQGGPLGLDGTGSRVELPFSQGLIEVSRWQMDKKKEKTVKFLQVLRSAPLIISCISSMLNFI